jgi:2-polyprenyl-3-methyl-5-hydroxy-6-metoxy-1,4-benzoquinol methylase
MRTREEFNQLYASPDPWGISRAAFRDRALARCVRPFVANKTVLELGSGEGHLTKTIFAEARRVTGIDISDVAVGRSMALGLPNAHFERGDFLDISFSGFDVIAAIECVYYLSRAEQNEFFDKIKREHAGGILIVSGPIIGGIYFTHAGLIREFDQLGYRLLECRNLYVRQHGAARPLDLAIRYLGTPKLLDWLPAALVYQRSYVVRV